MPEITWKGLGCAHCAAAVTKALESPLGVRDVQVDLTQGREGGVSCPEKIMPREGQETELLSPLPFNLSRVISGGGSFR